MERKLKLNRIVLVLFVIGAADLLLLRQEWFALVSNSALPSGLFNALRLIFDASPSTALGSIRLHLILIGFLLALLAMLHFTFDALNGFLENLFAKPLRSAVFIILFLSVLLAYYLAPGPIPLSGDANPHLLNFWLCRDSFTHGEWPVWSNWISCGSPFLQNYGPLLFYFTALFSLPFQTGPEGTIKGVLFLCHLLSGMIFMYSLRPMVRSPILRLLGGLIYVLAGWHSHFILIMGRFPIAPMYLFMPLIFKETLLLLKVPEAGERLFSPPALRLSVWLGLMFLFHYIYPFLFCFFLGVFVLGVLMFGGREGREGRRVQTLALRLGMALSLLVLLTAGFLIPFLVEKEATMAGHNMALESSLGSAGRTFSLFSWVAWNNPSLSAFEGRGWSDSYFGLSVFLLLAGCWILKAVRGKRDSFSPETRAAGVTLVALFALFAFWPALVKIPFLKFLWVADCQRYQMPFLFFLAIALPLCFQDLTASGILSPAFSRRLPPLMILVVLVDLGSLTLQNPYLFREGWDHHGKSAPLLKSEAARYAPDLPPYRAYYEGIGDYDWGIKGPVLSVLHAGCPAFIEPYGQGAPRSYLYVGNAYFKIRDPVLLKPRVDLYRPVANFFFLVNAPLLILNGERSIVQESLVVNRRVIEGEKTLIRLAFGSPFVYSNRLEEFEPDTNPRGYAAALLDRYRIDYASGRADAIRVLKGQAAPWASFAASSDTAATLRVKSYRVGRQEMEATVESSAPLFIRLPFSWHPALKVEIDGKNVTPLRTSMEFICVPVEKGTHAIRMVGGLSNLRKILLVVTAVAWLLWLLIYFKAAKRAGPA